MERERERERERESKINIIMNSDVNLNKFQSHPSTVQHLMQLHLLYVYKTVISAQN